MKSKHNIVTVLKAYRYILLSIWGILVSGCGSVFCQVKEPVSFAEKCHTFIFISGRSNINEFNFTYNAVQNRDLKVFGYPGDTGFIEFNIPIRDFEASNPLMYNDFLKSMKASEHPYIKISISGRQLAVTGNGSDPACPEIAITLAGITRNYLIDCTTYNCSDKLYINGSKKIRFSDFKLHPPEKLNGLVKVRDEIDVNFGFIVNFRNQIPAITSL